MAKHPNKFGDHCPACMMGQSSNAGEGTHLEGTIEHPQATAPLPEIASPECKHHWVIDGEDSVSHCDLCGLFEPDLDAIMPPIVRTLLDIATETPWPRKQIILDAANELLTRKGE